MSATTVETYKDELEGYDVSKGTIRFQPEKPLPSPRAKAEKARGFGGERATSVMRNRVTLLHVTEAL
jgi:hypothetical protein